MGVARKKLRQAEKKVYSMMTGRYLSGSEVGPGVRRAIRDLDDVRIKRAEAETARMEAARKAEAKREKARAAAKTRAENKTRGIDARSATMLAKRERAKRSKTD